MPEKHVNEFNINLTLVAPEVDKSNATAPQISGFAPNPRCGLSPNPRFENGFEIQYENGFEVIDGEYRRRGENGHGKKMQVGNVIYKDVAPDCIESFCEHCQKRVSTGLSDKNAPKQL